MIEPAPTSLASATRDEWSADHRHLGLVLLIGFAAFTFFYGLGGGPPLGDHDCINALAARNAINDGEWLIPQVHSAPLIRKTPLGVWLIGLAGKCAQFLGAAETVTAFTARVPSALAGIGTALAVFWLGSMLYGARIGLVAGFIAAGSAGIIGFARNSQVDMVLAFFVTLSMACFYRGALLGRPSRRFLCAFYVSFGMAMLAKAPLPLVMVGLPIAVHWFVALPIAKSFSQPTIEHTPLPGRIWTAFVRQLRGIGSLWLIPGVLLWLVLVAAWPVYVASKVDTALALWRIEYLSRFTGELSDKVKPFYYYIPLVFGLLFPFLGSLPEAVAVPFVRRYREVARAAAYPWVWAIVGTVFLSTAAFKRPHYLLSVLPAYCLLLAPVIDRLFFQAVAETGRAARALCMALPVLLLGGAIAGGFGVHREAPLMMPSYIIAAVIVVMVWALACWAYTRARRLTAFALLNAGTVAGLTIVWPALATGAGLNAETQALAAAMKKFEVDPARAIYWVDGQPNSTLTFYHGIPVRRLISEVEMASLRTGRQKITEEVYAAAVDRIKECLQEDPPASFVISAELFDLLRRRTDISIRETFRLSGIHEDAEDELVVFTRGG